jgi:cytoskeletal protein RodZ
MADVRYLFGSVSRNRSKDLGAPNNLVCLNDVDRVCDEPAVGTDSGGIAATFVIGAETPDAFATVQDPAATTELSLQSADARAGLEVDQTLGQLMTETRKRRGLSRDEVADQTNIPAYYVRMIESDIYDAIPDQLYLLPFFQRYANFLGLDAKKVVSRFISDFEKAENEVVATPAPRARVADTFLRWKQRALAANMLTRWRQGALAAVAIGILLPCIAWGIGTMRTANARHADKPRVAAISPNILTSSTILSADAPPKTAVVDPEAIPDAVTAPPAAIASNVRPETAPASHSPARSQRRRSRGHRLSRHARHSRHRARHLA